MCAHSRAACGHVIAGYAIASQQVIDGRAQLNGRQQSVSPALLPPILGRGSVSETSCFLHHLNGMLRVELHISVQDYSGRPSSRAR